ncbi:ABC transporter ATP-binding protein [Dactylosporangium sp. CA-139114]|uniref:ABC transporter ATP-binding protein n=1 Tax=Dactylosporangium sp. CA-139114 TaxID=3239931 RepID=UPI003D997F5D
MTTVESAAATAASATRMSVLRRGLALSPELFTGLAGTLGLALLATVGRVAVPVAIQQGIDRGIRAPGGPDLGVITRIVAVTAGVLLVTMVCSYLMNVRLFTVSETALAGIRARTFRHIHDLSMLHQQSERRGALVSRVTGDVDQISQFLQFGGLLFVVNLGQLTVTTIVMLWYSWQLTLIVFAAFAPLVFVVRFFQRRLSVLYLEVRESVGAMLGVIAESVVGAPVVRAYGIQRRTGERLDGAIERARRNQFRAQTNNVISMSFGELAAGLALGGVIVAGTLLGVGGHLTVGQLTAFLFLATLFVQPVQVATEVLNEAQNAIAGWRRVLDIIETEPDVADPGKEGRALPDGPIDVRFDHVHFAYPDGPEVLSDVDLTVTARTRVAVVGETGSGKTTFAKLLTRLMDPSTGRVLLSGVPLDTVRFDSLRSRVVMVPQDGFLFDATIADNVRFARPELTDADLLHAFTALGLNDWLESLPDGLRTQVGERGESLSVGERQLVALARAYVADPDLLVLDEATSAVDPATEVRLQRTLDAVTRGRTTIAIAHRLSTAQSADEVIVVDKGRVVQRGPHTALLSDPASIYARLYASWLEQTR